jgi:hypothetical protein
MSAIAQPRQSEGLRFVSGLAALPTGIRRIDGYLPELAAVIALAALIVLVFWIW